MNISVEKYLTMLYNSHTHGRGPGSNLYIYVSPQIYDEFAQNLVCIQREVYPAGDWSAFKTDKDKLDEQNTPKYLAFKAARMIKDPTMEKSFTDVVFRQGPKPQDIPSVNYPIGNYGDNCSLCKGSCIGHGDY